MTGPRTLARHCEDLGGIVVELHDAAWAVERDGEEFVEIPALDAVIATAAILRIRHPAALTGAEVRFLRKAMGLKAKDFAKMVEHSPETVSRWERGHAAVPGPTDKLIRHIVRDRLQPAAHVPAAGLTDLRLQPSVSRPPAIVLRLVDGGSEGGPRYREEALVA